MKTNDNNNSKQQARKRHQKQVRFCRTILGIATLVALTILLVLSAKAVGTMFVTGVKMWDISEGVQYYENERDVALETRRGNYATECDEHIRQLYAKRNALINSDNPVVAFTAVHKWYATGIILLFVGFIVGMVKVVYKHQEETFNVFTHVIDIEVFLFRVLIATVSFILMVIFALVGASTTQLAEVFNKVWNQSRPRRKPQQKTTKAAKTDTHHKANIIDFRKRA